ncbi:MAG: hypothetical protein VB095_03790 [Anaerovorax sp.]|nr:hypothetical protein [Anaerovorax sp.]
MNKKNLYVAIFMLLAGISCLVVSLQNGFSQIQRGTFVGSLMFFGFAGMFLRHLKD